MDPELTRLLAGLAEVAARNTSAAIYDRVTTIKAGKANQDTINQLTEIITELIEDKNDLIQISQGLEQQLVAERISDEDIDFITTSIVPTIEKLIALQEADVDSGEEQGASSTSQALELVKSLISPETLTVLQLLGFSFRDGIGEPLTMLCRRAILSRVPDPSGSNEIELTYAKAQLAQFEVAKDNASFKRYKEISKVEQ